MNGEVQASTEQDRFLQSVSFVFGASLEELEATYNMYAESGVALWQGAYGRYKKVPTYQCQILCDATDSELAKVWFRSCFAWDDTHLDAMCRWCMLQPTKGLQRGARYTRPLMQKALVVYGWNVIRKDVRKTREAVTGTPVEPAEVSAQVPQNFVVLCMGMWWTRGGRKVHPDTARLDQLERMVAPGVKVVADTLDGVEVVASEKQLLFDISRARTWSGTDPSKSITVINTTTTTTTSIITSATTATTTQTPPHHHHTTTTATTPPPPPPPP
jgi:hypothetical protein